MTLVYSLATRRRLVIGSPQARDRLCLPITEASLRAILACDEARQEMLVARLAEAIAVTLRDWTYPEEGVVPSVFQAEAPAPSTQEE